MLEIIQSIWNFINDVLFSKLVLISIFTACFLFFSSYYERIEKNEKIWTRAFIFVIFSAVLLIWTGISDKVEKNKNDSQTRIFNDSLLNINQYLAKKQAVIDSKQSVIDGKQDIINAKNDSIFGLQKGLNDSTQRVVDLQKTIINSQRDNTALQNELYKQAIGSKSFPLLLIDISDSAKSDLDYAYSIVARLQFSLYNPGLYTVRNIKISYDQFRYRYDSTFKIPETTTLPPLHVEVISEINLPTISIDPNGLTLLIKVSWQFEYTCMLHIDVGYDNSRIPLGYRYYLQYTFNGKKYSQDNIEDFKNDVLKAIP